MYRSLFSYKTDPPILMKNQRVMAILSEMGSATGKGDIISARRVLAKRLKVSEIVCVVIK
jgi:hypothetical protein